MTDISFDEHDSKFIERQLEAGRYRDASAVVRAGLRLLEDFEQSREHWLDEIPGRLSEILDDPSIGVPAEKVFADIDDRHRQRLARRQS